MAPIGLLSTEQVKVVLVEAGTDKIGVQGLLDNLKLNMTRCEPQSRIVVGIKYLLFVAVRIKAGELYPGAFSRVILDVVI